jgi:hypothetical protein
MSRKRSAYQASSTESSSADASLGLFATVESSVTPPAPCDRWLVKRAARISWYGHLTTLSEGSVVSLREYGPDGIARLREQGVEMEPVA